MFRGCGSRSGGRSERSSRQGAGRSRSKICRNRGALNYSRNLDRGRSRMPDIRKTTRTNRLMLTGRKAKQPLDLLRRGMPALDSIHDDSATFKSKGRTYRILKTTEVDSYETTPTAMALRKVLHGKLAPAP